MGFSLSGTEAWAAPSDQLVAGSYLMKPCAVERMTSSGDHPQAQVDWSVQAGPFKGAERRDWITVTEPALGRVVQLLEAADIAVPEKDFASLDELTDWLVEQLKVKLPVIEAVVRMEPDRKGTIDDKTGEVKVWPEIVGYKRPNPSDLDDDASGFAQQPGVNGQVCKQEDCQNPPTQRGYCTQHKAPF